MQPLRVAHLTCPLRLQGDQAERFVPPGTHTATLAFKGGEQKRSSEVTVEAGLRAFGTYRR